MTCRGHRVLVGCMAIAVLAGCGSSARSRSTPTSTGPASAATVTSTPSTTITESTSLQPDGLSFWVPGRALSSLGSPPQRALVALPPETTDAGVSWKQVLSATPITSVAPISAATARAVAGASGAAFATGTTLVYTTDGGRLWRAKPDPCREHLWAGVVGGGL